MIKFTDIRKGLELLRSDGTVALSQKAPDYFEWRFYKMLEPGFK